MRCNGKAVSRSTFYDHRKRRLQENVAALQPNITHPEGYIEGIGLGGMGKSFCYYQGYSLSCYNRCG